MTEPPNRPRCYRCLRPAHMCYCEALPTVPTRTRIEILQHPHERTHPFGTTRLLRLCMPNARVHVPFSGFSGTFNHPLDVPADAAVLYPHASAVDLETLPRDQWPSTLIAIDGTWAHAKRLYRENTWLHNMRHVRLQPREPSRYRIRREPRPDYISTLEAVVLALRIIEPDAQDLNALITAFDRMIDRQISHRSSRREHRFKVRRPRESRALPPVVQHDDLIVAYAESSLPGGDSSSRRELVHWVAGRVTTGETFEAILRPPGAMPTREHIEHMGMCYEAIEQGETLAAARQRFHAWVPDGAPVAAWTNTSLAWGDAMIPANSERTLLKTAYCNVAQRRAGYLEQIVAREQLTPTPVACSGRAGDRLSNALAIATWLRAAPRITST